MLTVMPAGAQGLPLVLPEEAKSKTDGLNVGTPIFKGLSGLKITCSAASGNTEEPTAGKALGPMHLTFTGCHGELGTIKSACMGLGDNTSGEILMLGEYHLVYDT